MYPKKLQELNFKDQKVIVKCDYNVPIKDGTVADEYRIDVTIPTLKYILEQGGTLILLSHMGRPDGQRNPEFSLKPVQETVAAKLGHEVKLIDDFTTAESLSTIQNAAVGSIFLLENIRFYAAEQSKGQAERDEFAKQLAQLGTVYVNEAFGDYRKHVSNTELPKLIEERALGMRFAKEVEVLEKLLQNPERPFVAVLGGAKLSEKIDIMNKLGKIADKIIVGGAMAYTLLRTQGHTTGNSLVEADKLDVAKQILDQYGDKLLLPIDHVCANSFNPDAEPQQVTGKDIPDGLWALDIGQNTIDSYIAALNDAKTILWNGPMGVFEWINYAEGTRQVGIKIADQAAYTVAGGGDTLNAASMFDLEYGIDHSSVGGGAMLEYLATGTLPILS